MGFVDFIHPGLLNPPSGVEDGYSLGVLSRHVEVNASLTLGLNAFYADDTSRPSALAHPEHNEFIGYTIPITAVGSHTSVSVVFTLPYQGTTTAGIVLNDITLPDLELEFEAANSGWACTAANVGSDLRLTFTIASLAAGSYTLDMRCTSIAYNWAKWKFGSSSTLGGGTVYTGPATVTVTGGSTEAPTATGYSNTTVYVADITSSTSFSPNPGTQGTAVQFTVTHRNEGVGAGTNSMTITASGAGLTSPTTITNTDGWTIGSWTGSGPYVCTATKGGTIASASSITFSTTPASNGTLTIAIAASNDNGVTGAASSNDTINASWTLDATSGKGVPANATEWAAVMSAAGIGSGGPSLLWLLQEASGNAADSIGSITGFVGGSPTYQSAVSGWTRKGMLFADSGGPGGGSINSTSGSLPDLSTTSMLVLTYSLITATPGGTRNMVQLADVGRAFVQINNTPRLVGTSDGGGAATGSNTVTGAVRPFFTRIDQTGNTYITGSDQEILTPTFYGSFSGKQLALGQFSCPPVSHTYAVAFFGTAAELSNAQIKTLLQTLGWSIPW